MSRKWAASKDDGTPANHNKAQHQSSACQPIRIYERTSPLLMAHQFDADRSAGVALSRALNK